ncbi:MAG: bifunctional sugar phosphate isomerase/epimerase/4-hydroxyphenylpyruvate dioxygenase family protein [Solirubrobacteraceae bacterium]
MSTRALPLPHGIATVCLSGTLEDKLAAAARAGFDGVEIFEPDLIGSTLSPTQLRDRAAQLGLTIDLYQPFRDFEAVGEAQLARNLRRAEAKLEVMQALGAPMLLVCSNVSATAIDDDRVAAAQLRSLAERADRRGLKIAYEALAWGRHVNEYDHAWRIVQAADHPALGLALDSFHTLSRGTSLDALAEIEAEKLFFLQLADAPNLSMDVLQWSRHYRCFPGQGGLDVSGFLERVLAAGYEGPLSLEVFNDVFRQADPDRMAVDAKRSLLILEESLARGHPRTSARAAPPAPSPPQLGGYAFVELAVEPGSVGATQRALHGLGFAATSQHRSKPVTLWQQGSTRVLLNADAPTAPGVAAIAVESSDPGRSTRRAQALLAPVLERWRGPGEAELAAVAAPDGTATFFCRSDAGAQAGGWLRDFEQMAVAPTGSAPPPGGPAPGLDGIDHIALAEPFDYFDEAVLFYSSLLGLEPLESLELNAPTGLVRSRAVTNRDGTVRLALNVPLLAHASGEADALQHVAFACGDVLEVARRLRARGVQALPIPANYYADLAARTDLEPHLIESLQALDVLYDGAGKADFLHFYTPVLGGRLFFEVVQRRCGYEGYGAANAPVRMAAQRAVARRAPGEALKLPRVGADQMD